MHEPEAPERPWYDAAFDADYLQVYPHRDFSAAQGEVEGLLERGLVPAAAAAPRVLDLGCGFGRHSLALAAAGVWVAGLDRSADLLAHAAEFARARHAVGEVPDARLLAGRLVRGDFRRLPFLDAAFDAVLMLFSSFGYFDDRTNAWVLGEVTRLLAPGGVLVLDLMNAERIRRTLVPESRSARAGGELHERRRLLEGGRRVRKDVVLRAADGRERRWHEDVRLYDLPELEESLATAGLELVRAEGDFDGRPPAPDAPRTLLWARRP